MNPIILIVIVIFMWKCPLTFFYVFFRKLDCHFRNKPKQIKIFCLFSMRVSKNGIFSMCERCSQCIKFLTYLQFSLSLTRWRFPIWYHRWKPEFLVPCYSLRHTYKWKLRHHDWWKCLTIKPKLLSLASPNSLKMKANCFLGWEILYVSFVMPVILMTIISEDGSYFH